MCNYSPSCIVSEVALAYFTNCGFSPSWQSWFLLLLITTCSFSVGLMLDTVWTSEHACAVYPRQHLFPFSPLLYPSHKGRVPFYISVAVVWASPPDFCHTNYVTIWWCVKSSRLFFLFPKLLALYGHKRCLSDWHFISLFFSFPL